MQVYIQPYKLSVFQVKIPAKLPKK